MLTVPTTMQVDFGRTAGDYGRHRAGLPARFSAELERLVGGLEGRHVLDLGSGTGAAARPLSAAGARVTALDPALAMLREQARLADEAGLFVSLVGGRAEHTGFATASFDVVVAVQCWHWFDAAAAGRELARVLRPGGFAVLASHDWLPLPGSVPMASEELVEAHSPTWDMGGGDGLHPEYTRDLSVAGLDVLHDIVHDEDVPYSHEAWRGRMRASAGIGALLAPDAIARFDKELAELLRERFPSEPLAVPHRMQIVVAVRR